MKTCTDPTGDWPDNLADVSSHCMGSFLAHAKACLYHEAIVNKQFERELRSVFRLAGGLDDAGRPLHEAELDNAIAENQSCFSQWEAAGKSETPFSRIALYNGGRLIAGSGKFRQYTYHKALHDLDPRAGLQVRVLCSNNTDEEALLGFYPLRGAHHGGHETLLPLDNGHTAGLRVKQVGDRKFVVHFRCVENSLAEHAQLEGIDKDRATAPAPVYVLNEPLLDECTDEVKLLILEIRHLANHQRYEEALNLAKKATRIAPGYWRAQINLGSLLVMSGKVDEGEEIFRKVLKDCSDNPKAVAAALHCCAGAKENRRRLHSATEESVREEALLYEEALQVDGSIVYTRACLLVTTISDEGYDSELLEDSVKCEGFFDALQFALAEYAPKDGAAWINKVLHALPMRLRSLLSLTIPSCTGEYGH